MITFETFVEKMYPDAASDYRAATNMSGLVLTLWAWCSSNRPEIITAWNRRGSQ